MPFGQRCAFACQPGFRLTGPSLRECILPGIWTGGTLSTRCLDTTPPQIHCPSDMIVKTDPELYYATLNMSLPKGLGKIFFLPPGLNKLYLLSRDGDRYLEQTPFCFLPWGCPLFQIRHTHFEFPATYSYKLDLFPHLMYLSCWS